MSKEVLLGKEPAESSYLWPEGSFDELGIELRTGVEATAIDRDIQGRSRFSDGGSIAYDKLLIATGGRVRKLPVEGAELDGVHYLRGIDDSAAIRADLGEGANLVVIGGGWIGLEVAAAARMLGAEVTVVEALDMLCARALTPDMAAYLLDIHRGRGVDVRLGATIEALTGEGRVNGARLSGGEVLPATAVVIGIGIVPNVELAEAAGLAVDNGIAVDALCRTSDPDIFAAGDVTNHPNGLLGRSIRLESWENAQNQGIAAAKAMLGGETPLLRDSVVLVGPVRRQHPARRTAGRFQRDRDAGRARRRQLRRVLHEGRPDRRRGRDRQPARHPFRQAPDAGGKDRRSGRARRSVSKAPGAAQGLSPGPPNQLPPFNPPAFGFQSVGTNLSIGRQTRDGAMYPASSSGGFEKPWRSSFHRSGKRMATG